MRDAFIRSIYKETKKNNKVMCLVGDIGAFLLRHYIEDFPDNFLNLGPAEANMIGVAAGLAMSGKIPFVYTITPFVTSRCYEQVKDDICYNNVNVKLVGIGSGVSYGTMGSTHHSLEDIAIMRVLPNMTILSPSDPLEVEEAMAAAVNHIGPVYIRLMLQSKPLDYDRGIFKIGKSRLVKKGNDAVVLATGDMVAVAIEASELLQKEGINTGVINMHTLKPIDAQYIQELSQKYKAIITLEEHSSVGGLGSAVASILSQYKDNKTHFKIMGFDDVFCKEYSKNKFHILETYGLSANHVAKNVRELLL